MPFPKTRAEMEAAGYVRDGHEVCKGCGAEMQFWITPERQKAIPMNPMAHPTSEAITHFATCPMAAQFRKRGAK